MKLILGLDIGGTHIAGALIDSGNGKLVKESYSQSPVNTAADRSTILKEWKKGIENILRDRDLSTISGIGVAMPGPFDYDKGISLIKDLGKYDHLYGVNIREALKKELQLPADFPLYFQNDAICFALGEYRYGSARSCHHVVALTLGTGFGAAFLSDGIPQTEGKGVPEGGTLYQISYNEGMAEDQFSTRGLLKQYQSLTGERLNGAEQIYNKAIKQEAAAQKVFADFGEHLAEFLIPWLQSFDADCLVLGGSISKASVFFLDYMQKVFNNVQLKSKIFMSELEKKAAILGAASLLKNINQPENKGLLRKTTQPVLPLKKQETVIDAYDIFPTFQLDAGKISEGMASLATYIISQRTVIIDGYVGVFWESLQASLVEFLKDIGLKVHIYNTEDWLLPEGEINTMTAPYLGREEDVWGAKYDKDLIAFYDKEKIDECVPDPNADINIVMGVGAAFTHWKVPIIYFDLPKNEVQFRMRAGSITNLGYKKPQSSRQMYKRFYFIDWVLLNQHKKTILERITVMADSQRADTLTWTYMHHLKAALQTLGENVFRVRPWFEPGAWGGQWIKKNIKGLNTDVVNYAWSFELITPENGLLFESEGLLLEISFDVLMFLHNKEVLGETFAKRFGDEFPIRFDFLDTIKGGNLSIQCHPSTDYIHNHFGESITQDETYYILEAEEEASVYLGFQEDIDPVPFREELEQSKEHHIPVDIKKYVQSHPAKKHDLFLIPNGTIHSAAAGNLVLEISATPYIFTFKMYDWLRLDLNGKPRPINIDHAFHNLDFNLKGEKVTETLIPKPILLNSGPGWKQIHLPTHPKHFYDIHRYEFDHQVQIDTAGSCHIMMLVEGNAITVETKKGFRQRFHYAETFVIPAAAESYVLINEGDKEAKVVKGFLKGEN